MNRTQFINLIKPYVIPEMQYKCSIKLQDRETSLKDDLEMDSLDAVELNLAIEEAFGITISDEALEGFVTVGDIVNYLEAM